MSGVNAFGNGNTNPPPLSANEDGEEAEDKAVPRVCEAAVLAEDAKAAEVVRPELPVAEALGVGTCRGSIGAN